MRSPTQIVVDAKPEALPIAPARSAAIAVDMQNDFGSEGGMFALAGIDISGIRKAIAPTARALAAARRASINVVYLKMGFRPDLSDAGGPDVPNWVKHGNCAWAKQLPPRMGRQVGYLIRDTWNTDILPDLAPEPGDVVLYKHRYSGFYETDLDNILQRVSRKSVLEIQKLIAELETLRDYPQSEGQRIQRQIAEYAHMSQAAMKSTKTIAESLAQWRQTAERGRAARG